MRQELPSGPTDDIDGEPSRAQNTPVCMSTWPLDLDSQAARYGGSARLSKGFRLACGQGQGWHAPVPAF